MKLIIQIPCYNEEETLAETLHDLPRKVEGFDRVEWLIVDDGCTDRTVEVARANGVDHIVRQPVNRGLAKAFLKGLESSVSYGADVIVNTDADNQYNAKGIHELVKPIVGGQADIVVGARPISEIEEFSPIKKLLQKLGSSVVRKFSNTNVTDAPSGFRAFSREAARMLNVFSEYTYTLETLIQAGQSGLSIINVPVRVNSKTRESRLVKNIFSYVNRSIATLFRIYVIYKPMRFFLTIGTILNVIGGLIGLRFLYYFITEGEAGKIQSLILAAILIGSGIQMFVVGVISDLLSVNRRLLQQNQLRLKYIEEKLTSESKINTRK
ncbi:glycosyltransferase family 2 protein [Pelagicoccus sp. SDUM812003]|uniref:glycosyltransferase family 2 protein n=1 Tax=Pelagicoccus sp. SDUM812003 TaxID=3041267 RepID=UPI00280D4353|nr:glycosyltransferase family 2 protein [Pelagicoccus sp. SDUM812003]MDQ8204245.1 glycosyltransferase family 2 protein [Pelagicoccus sp. SDUM812003]